jgi:hypothetical protein
MSICIIHGYTHYERKYTRRATDVWVRLQDGVRAGGVLQRVGTQCAVLCIRA